MILSERSAQHKRFLTLSSFNLLFIIKGKYTMPTKPTTLEILDKPGLQKSGINPPSDCTIPIDNGLINIRVGAVIRKGNQFLMVGNDQQDYLYSVGGRVKFGETAEQAVIREVFEETGIEMEVDHLGFIQENFFYGDTGIKKDKLIYEISYYFYMKVPEEFQPKCESFTDDNSRENLVWVTTDCKQILYPEFFRTELEDPKPYVIHIVTDERQAGEGKKDHGTV